VEGTHAREGLRIRGKGEEERKEGRLASTQRVILCGKRKKDGEDLHWLPHSLSRIG